MAETGQHDVPQVGKLHVLNRNDAARLLRWSLLYSLQNPIEGYEIRQLLRQMKSFLRPADALMLAELVKDSHPQLAQELVAQATGEER